MKQKRTPQKPPALRTAADRLRFVADFAQMDLDALRPSGWAKLREDFTEFLALPGTQAVACVETDHGLLYGSVSEPPHPTYYPEWAFRELQTEIRTLLEALVHDREGTPREITAIKTEVSYIVQSTGPGHDKPGTAVIAILGRMRDVFLSLFFALLAQENMHHLLRCPECGTIFYGKRNQLYCTRACMNRVTQRNFRARIVGVAVTKEAAGAIKVNAETVVGQAVTKEAAGAIKVNTDTSVSPSTKSVT
jgi:hypothetical protein